MAQSFRQCTYCNMVSTDYNMPQSFRQCTYCNMVSTDYMPQWFRQCTDCNMPQWFRQCTYCNMHSVQTVIGHNDYDCVQIVVCHIMCFTFGSVPDMCKNDQFCQCYVRVKQKCWRHWMAKPWLTSACNFWTVWSISKVRSHVHTHTQLENVKHPQNDRPHCQWFHA